jgi:hypothetical protein
MWGVMNVGRGIDTTRHAGVCSNLRNAYAVPHSCLLTSFLLFHCMHDRSCHRMPPCLHIRSRRAHAGLE